MKYLTECIWPVSLVIWLTYTHTQNLLWGKLNDHTGLKRLWTPFALLLGHWEWKDSLQFARVGNCVVTAIGSYRVSFLLGGAASGAATPKPCPPTRTGTVSTWLSFYLLWILDSCSETKKKLPNLVSVARLFKGKFGSISRTVYVSLLLSLCPTAF